MANLQQASRHLSKLELKHTAVDNHDFTSICCLTALTKLVIICEHANMAPQATHDISKLQNLRHLNVQSRQGTRIVLPDGMSLLNKLTSLQLKNASVTMKSISSLTDLQRLRLHDGSAQVSQHLHSMIKLTELKLDIVELNGNMQALSSLIGLKYLSFWCCTFEAAADNCQQLLSALPFLRNLQDFTLEKRQDSVDMFEVDMAALERLPELACLHIYANLARALPPTSLINLTMLLLHGISGMVSVPTAAAFPALPLLQDLELASEEPEFQVSEPSEGLCNKLPSLRTLGITHSSREGWSAESLAFCHAMSFIVAQHRIGLQRFDFC